jgi:hypothetical protein
MEIKEIKKLEKKLFKYFCELCDFKCYQKCDWEKHIKRQKHITNTEGNEKLEKSFLCGCGKFFQTNAGLWKHKSKGGCVKQNIQSEPPLKEEPIKTEDLQLQEITKKEDLIIMLLKQNADLMELVKNGTNNNSNNTTHINSHNKAFNLNFFLNETCKNAMNITEFVDSIQWELDDLMELGEIGYVASMSKIITKKLNALDETVRPIHCADKKREIFYIKDDNKWEKEDEDLKRLRKIILRLSNKSLKLLPKYREKFPDYNDAKSIHSDEHCKIIIEAVTCDSAKDEKIIRNISKATMISKCLN